MKRRTTTIHDENVNAIVWALRWITVALLIIAVLLLASLR